MPLPVWSTLSLIGVSNMPGELAAVGVSIAVAGNTLIACSLALQKHVHNRYAATPFQSPLFWFALVGMVVGEVGNFAAFGFASPTVISPLGAVAVIANAALAVVFLREAVFLHTIMGLLLTVLHRCRSLLAAHARDPHRG